MAATKKSDGKSTVDSKSETAKGTTSKSAGSSKSDNAKDTKKSGSK